jgi:hypothetical protein
MKPITSDGVCQIELRSACGSADGVAEPAAAFRGVGHRPESVSSTEGRARATPAAPTRAAQAQAWPSVYRPCDCHATALRSGRLAETSGEEHGVSLVDAREQRDDAYRAIGRYTVQFSLLAAGMREIIAEHIAGNDKAAAQLAFGSLTAKQIADPFFAICRTAADLDTDEQKIEQCLRKHVNEAITERNRIMRGDWFIARWTRGDLAAPSAALVRVTPSNTKKPAVEQRNFKVADIDEIAERVGALKNVVGVRDDLHRAMGSRARQRTAEGARAGCPPHR